MWKDCFVILYAVCDGQISYHKLMCVAFYGASIDRLDEKWKSEEKNS